MQEPSANFGYGFAAGLVSGSLSHVDWLDWWQQ